MSTHLVGDIGGTHSRFALVPDEGAPGTPAVFRNADYPDFDALLAAYLQRQAVAPTVAAFAVAGPVVDAHVHMTNLGWTLDGAELCDVHGFDTCNLMNDFAALAWATLYLGRDSLMPIGGGAAVADGNRAVLGPGTGLGVSGLVRAGDDWAVVAGEGGHVSMAARTVQEAELIAAIADKYGHCSAERVLSGPGIARIYTHLTGRSLPPEAVTAQAAAGEDEAVQALALFFDLLGTAASDLALTLGAQGGVYLAGGILPQLSRTLSRSGFRARFESKARLGDYLAGVPTWLITAPYPSLTGLAGFLQRN